MKKTLFIFALTFSPTLFAGNQSCEENFIEDGGFFSGKVFKTWSEFPQVDKANAYKRIYLYTVKTAIK
jgi:hypothetical protein